MGYIIKTILIAFVLLMVWDIWVNFHNNICPMCDEVSDDCKCYDKYKELKQE